MYYNHISAAKVQQKLHIRKFLSVFFANRIEFYVLEAAYMQHVLAFMWHTELNFIFFSDKMYIY